MNELNVVQMFFFVFYFDLIDKFEFNWANATFWLCGENGAADWLLGADMTPAIGCWIGGKHRSRRSPSNSNNAATSASCCWPLSSCPVQLIHRNQNQK